MSQEHALIVAPDGRPAADSERCPECGSRDLEAVSGFGGWQTVICGRCRRAVQERRE